MELQWKQPADWSQDGSVISDVAGLKTGAWTALYTAHETVAGKTTEVILKTFTIPEAARDDEKKIAVEREKFLVSAKLQQSLTNDGAAGWVKILRISENPPSFTMPKCGPSAEDLLDHKVNLTGRDLYSVLQSILLALMELKQRHDRSHGDLKASNVLAAAPGDSPAFKLADPAPRGESHSANDLYNLGLLLYQLIEHKEYDPLVQLTPSKNWARLGARRDRWIHFLQLLLSPNGCQDPLADVQREARRLKPVSPLRPVFLAMTGLVLLALVGSGVYVLNKRLNPPAPPPQAVASSAPAPAAVDPQVKAAYDQARQKYQEARAHWSATPRTPRYDHSKSIALARQARSLSDQVSLTGGYAAATDFYVKASAKLTDAIAQANAEEEAGKAADRTSVADLQQAQQEYAATKAKWSAVSQKFVSGHDHTRSRALAESGQAAVPSTASMGDSTTDPAARRLALEQYKAATAKLAAALAAVPEEDQAFASHEKSLALFQKARDDYRDSQARWDAFVAAHKDLDLTEATKLADDGHDDLADPLVLTDDASYRAAAERTYNASQKIEQALALAARAKPIVKVVPRPPVIVVKRDPAPAIQPPVHPVQPTADPGSITPSKLPPATKPVETKPAINPADVAAAVARADAALKVKSYVEAFGLYKKAAELGSVGAMCNVGLLLETGTGTTRDYVQAAEWYKKAAEMNCVPAIVNLASLYQKGQGVDQNYTQAMNLYKRAAALKNADAMVSLGNLYEKGEGAERNYPEALKWYKQAADLGNAAAITNVGVFYEKGRGIAVDYKAAADWYKKAAALDYAPAMNDLAVLYDNGKYDNSKDTKPDYAAALKWYAKAAQHDYAPAMCNLGALYDNGQGVPLDHAQALKWFEKAAEKNHPMAMYNLGVLYDNGRGTAPDRAQAITWYRKAAHSEDPVAQRLALDALNRLGFTP